MRHSFNFRRENCILQLMATDFVQSVHKLCQTDHQIEDCWSCHNINNIANDVLLALANIAESASVIGALGLQLHRGDLLTKQKLVLTIPYIIR